MAQLAPDHTITNEEDARLPDGTYDTYAINAFHIIGKHYGPPTNVRPVSDEAVARYRERLPDDLLDFWIEYGWGAWTGGKFWLCDPGIVQPVLNAALTGDTEFDPDQAVGFGYTAFGQIEVWLGDGATMRIDIPGSYVSVARRWYNDRVGRWDTDHNIIASLIQDRMHAGFALKTDHEDRDLLPPAIERHGILDWNEMYGFVPALSLGGLMVADHIERVPLIEHLLFLLQLERPTLYAYTEPEAGEAGFGSLTPVRKLGAQ